MFFQVLPSTRSGRPSVVLHFDKPVTVPLQLLVYCEYNAVLSINKDYRIDLSYDTAG